MAKTMMDANEKKLLALIQNKPIPAYRQAYSDRTAWLMAAMSEIAYKNFGGLDVEATKTLLQNALDKLLEEKKSRALNNLVKEIFARDADATQKFIAHVKEYGPEVKEVYDHEGTQAFLAKSGRNLILAFRGTEVNSFKEIKHDVTADLDAVKIECKSGGGVHRGFNNAYEKVAWKIQHDLDKAEYAKKPLLITGHSLGGALATIAAKRLTHKIGIAACYTFGAPRVGNEKWSYDIKTPIYRVVNAVDCVPMLPPGGQFISALKFILEFVPKIGDVIINLLKHIEGYIHVGDMRYLTNCPSGKYEKVKLTYHVNLFRRIWIVLTRNRFSKFVADHSISIYRKKLAVIAKRHNQF